MGYKQAHAPIYGYMKGYKHTIPLHLVYYARTFSIFKLLNTLELGRVLNVGGCDGYQSYLIQKIFCADVVTVDLDINALKIAQSSYGLKVCSGSALDLPFRDKSFDTVICIETIEHINNPGKVVSELKRVAKSNVIISTESFFDSYEQIDSFMLYLHETHPQFFKKKDPIKPGDVSYFTVDCFFTLFGTKKLKFYPQFSDKHAEILGNATEIRKHVKMMTENIPINKQTKIIVCYATASSKMRVKQVSEEKMLEEIVADKAAFDISLDSEMISEDNENIKRITEWHDQKNYCEIKRSSAASTSLIEEDGAKGVSLQWLSQDNLEKSPKFCMRKVFIEKNGCTPGRQTSWEHQIYILAGDGKLIEKTKERHVSAGDIIIIKENIFFKLENVGYETLVYLDIVPSITCYFGR